jgi:hypothetical protein
LIWFRELCPHLKSKLGTIPKRTFVSNLTKNKRLLGFGLPLLVIFARQQNNFRRMHFWTDATTNHKNNNMDNASA